MSHTSLPPPAAPWTWLSPVSIGLSEAPDPSRGMIAVVSCMAGDLDLGVFRLGFLLALVRNYCSGDSLSREQRLQVRDTVGLHAEMQQYIMVTCLLILPAIASISLFCCLLRLARHVRGAIARDITVVPTTCHELARALCPARRRCLLVHLGVICRYCTSKMRGAHEVWRPTGMPVLHARVARPGRHLPEVCESRPKNFHRKVHLAI